MEKTEEKKIHIDETDFFFSKMRNTEYYEENKEETEKEDRFYQEYDPNKEKER